MFDKEIKELRDSIDSLDKDLLKNVANRMQLVRKVGTLKKKNNVEVVQNEMLQAGE